MTFIDRHLILGTLFAALVCATVAVSPTGTEAGPKGGGGFLGITNTDLGSGR